MLFEDTLKEKTVCIKPEFEKLLKIALAKQSHLGDLLLLYSHGYYEPELLKFDKKFSPFAVGRDQIGLSENTHYKFIDEYRKKNVTEGMTYSTYKDALLKSNGHHEEAVKLFNTEGLSIQYEMILYLKIWESDMMFKKLYQFARILNGEHYDWFAKISKSNRGNNSLNRGKVLSYIKDSIEVHSPILHRIINDTYNSQIRNSIAHSNYSFSGRVINLGNYIEDDPHSKLQTITFDKWIDIFHNTIIFHNEYIRLNLMINKHYSGISSYSEIQITQHDGTHYTTNIHYNPEWQDWQYLV